uniref:Uncharacterized protein n=2 Tax=Hemiselmis andersenii TaxID=464988 RepID=A0A6U2AKX4_HEMAN|mmetsp:Transcript_1186/g.2832  ORF Transcript_1186/g.2832 Transcript_1186/m.2832 type:complete len:557 (+) Transcript_1186:32-1702(+)
MAKGHAAVAPHRRAEESRPLLRTALCAAALGVIAVVLLSGQGRGGASNSRRVELGVEANLIAQEAVTNHKSDSSAKAINKAATAAVATIVKDDKNEKTSLASSPTAKKQSLGDDEAEEGDEPDMSREIKELAKQEKIHFEARRKALQAAIKATSDCKPDAKDYKECMQARKHVDWKMAKDKYEQAAMSDISKETDKEKASEAGELMFKRYRLLAGTLSGNSQLSQLYNQTRTAAAAKHHKEQEAIVALRKEEKELHKVEQAKAALRHKKQEEMQAKANAEEHNSLKMEQERITRSRKYAAMYKDAAKGDAARQARAAKQLQAYKAAKERDTASKAELARIDANPYEQDLAAAKKAELARREAFKEYVAEMRKHDAQDKARRLALKNASAAKPAAAKVPTKTTSMAQVAAGKYSSDVAKALRVSKQQQAVERAVVQVDKQKHAQAEQERSNTIANGGKAARAMVSKAGGRADVTSSEEFERQLEEAKEREVARVAADGRARDEAREARAKAVRKLDDASREEMVQALSKTADRIVGIEEPKAKAKAKPSKSLNALAQ